MKTKRINLTGGKNPTVATYHVDYDDIYVTEQVLTYEELETLYLWARSVKRERDKQNTPLV